MNEVFVEVKLRVNCTSSKLIAFRKVLKREGQIVQGLLI